MNYDVVVVVKPEEEITKAEARIKALIEAEGFKVVNQEAWGKKQLAYPLKKQTQGVFLAFEVNSDKAMPVNLNARFKVDDSVLRTLILRKEVKKVKKARVVKEAVAA